MTCQLCERLKMEAQIHAMEARGANYTIQKIYQIVTGASGEPGNWNAEVPVRDEITELRMTLGNLAEAVAAEVNEKGGSGYLLARLTDARNALKPRALRRAERDMEAAR
jgi:hypothetical protein